MTVDSLNIVPGDMLSIDDGRTLSLDGIGSAVISNHGTITLAASAGPTSLRPIDQLMLSGSGALQLTDQNHSRIIGSHVDVQLINQLGHRIQGSGKMGLNHMRLINHATIDATESSSSLTIDTSGTLENNFNTGVIHARDDARLVFNASKVTNFQATGQGLIHANGGQVYLDSKSAISSGLLQVDGAQGLLSVPGSSYISGGVQVDGTNGSITVQGASVIEGVVVEVNEGKLNVFANGAVTNSTINISAAGALNLSSARFGGSTLSNSGAVNVLNDSDLGTTDLINQQEGLLLLRNGETLRVASSSHQNDGTMTLGGSGELQLTDANNSRINSHGYTQTEGRTILDGGTLSGPNAIDFLGGRLEGRGTVVEDVNFSGLGTTIAPGFSAGVDWGERVAAMGLAEVPEPATMMRLIVIGAIQPLRRL